MNTSRITAIPEGWDRTSRPWNLSALIRGSQKYTGVKQEQIIVDPTPAGGGSSRFETTRKRHLQTAQGGRRTPKRNVPRRLPGLGRLVRLVGRKGCSSSNPFILVVKVMNGGATSCIIGVKGLDVCLGVKQMLFSNFRARGHEYLRA